MKVPEVSKSENGMFFLANFVDVVKWVGTSGFAKREKGDRRARWRSRSGEHSDLRRMI